MTIISVSCLDIQTLPQFSGMTVFEIIDKKNDNVIGNLCKALGADLNEGLYVQACQHRCRTSKSPVVNYRYVFYERTDREWIRGGKADITMLIETQRDVSLAMELAILSGLGLGTLSRNMQANTKNRTADYERKKIAEQQLDNAKSIVDNIKALQDIQRQIRGEVHEYEDVFNA